MATQVKGFTTVMIFGDQVKTFLTLDELKEYVAGDAGGGITQAELDLKADKTYVDAELKKKAATGDVTKKADKTYVDTELGKKADTGAVASKAEKSYVDTELGKKLTLPTGAKEGDVVTFSGGSWVAKAPTTGA